MSITNTIRPLLTAGLLAAALPTGSALAAAITSGTATLNILTPVFTSGTGDADLTFPGITDQQSRLTWYYRSATGSNSLFSSLDSPTTSFVGNTATVTYTNAGPGAAGFARFNAVFVFTLTSTATGQAQVNTVLTFTSMATNTATQTFNLFNVIGFDLGANGVADTYHVTDNTAIAGTVTDTGSSGNVVNFQENGASRYAFNSGSTLNSNLTTGTTNLATAAGANASDFSSAAGAAAFQYTATLAPGQSTTITTVYALNQPILAVPEPSTWAMMLAATGVVVAAGARRQRRRMRASSAAA